MKPVALPVLATLLVAAALPQQLTATGHDVNEAPAVTTSSARAHCGRDVRAELGSALRNFGVGLHRVAAAYYDHHFLMSPFSMWLSLAALAEGTVGDTQRELFTVLSLPTDACSRSLFYSLAFRLETLDGDVQLYRRRLLAVDDEANPDPVWTELVTRAQLLQVVRFPLLDDPAEASRGMSAAIDADLSALPTWEGPLVLDALDFTAAWETGFDRVEVDAPFYDEGGAQISSVDMMRARRRVELAHSAELRVKVLRLPLGRGARYWLVAALPVAGGSVRAASDMLTRHLLDRALLEFHTTPHDIDVGLPRMSFTMQHDNVRHLLERSNVSLLWSSPPRATPGPGAAPTGYVQRVSLRLAPRGLRSYNDAPDPAVPAEPVAEDAVRAGDAALQEVLLQQFVADRPFAFAVLDWATGAAHLTGVYSSPLPIETLP